MFIGIKGRLERILDERKDNTPEEDIPSKGTVVVIDGELKFHMTDGFINFMCLALDQIPKAYGEQHSEWQERLDRLRDAACSLKDANTRFTGSTREEFKEYCKQVSHVLDGDADKKMEDIPIVMETSDDLVPFLQAQVDKGNTRGFYYGPSEDPVKGFMRDLMGQLSGIKISKDHTNGDISFYLTTNGYHEHVHDALNLIMQTAVYAINCSSTRRRDAFFFDTQEVDSKLEYVTSIIQRTQHII